MYGYVYELYFDSAWIDVSALVHTKNAKVTFNAFGSNLQGSRDVSTITLMHGHDPRKSLAFHSDIYRRLLEAKNNRSVVKFRLLHGTDPVFTGNVDLGNLKQSTGSIPEQISLEIEDNSYLLDNSIEQSFEYPSDAIVDSSGNILADPIFAKADPANSILVKLVMMAGYSPSDIDFTGSNDVKVGDSLARIRLVYDAEEKRTYRDLLDTLLMEYRYVLTNNADGKFCIKRTFVTEEQEAPEIPEYLINDKITSAGGDYQKDGAAVKWSTLEHSKDMTVYQGSMTPTFDENGLKVDDGEEVNAEGYWPETGDIEEVWFEFDTKFLDRPYLTKKSRLKNKDLSLITTRNIQYEIDADPEISEVTEIRQLLPKKARLLFYNSAIISKYIRGFNMIGDVLYRKKISTYTSPETAKNPEEYESEFLFDSEAADQLASHMFLMHNYGDMTYTWTQKTNINILDLVTVKIPGTSVATKALVKSVTKTFPTAGHMFCKVTAIGVSIFNLLPSKKVAWMNGSGTKGEKGETLIHQYAVGDDGEVPPTFIAVLDADGNPLGYNSDAVGFMDEWSSIKPSVPVDKYLWHRYRYPSDNEWTYVIETRPVASNAPYTRYAYISAVEAPATPTGDSSTIPTGWSETPPARVSGEVIYVATSQVSWSSKNEEVYGTWSVPTAWSGDKGEQGEQGVEGESAKGVQLFFSSDTLPTTSRGVPKIGIITCTALPQNLTVTQASDITWQCTDSAVTLTPKENDIFSVEIDTSEVSVSSFYITAIIGDYGITRGINVVADGKPAPIYFGKLTALPQATPQGEPLVDGDYFMVGEQFVEGGVTYKLATLWEYDSGSWVLSTDKAKALNAMGDFASIAEQAEDGIFCRVIAKEVYAQTAVIEEIFSKNITVTEDGSVGSEDFTEDSQGVPTSGFMFDNPLTPTGRRGRVRSHGGIFNDATILGTILHPALETRKSSPTTPVTFPSKTAWNRKSFWNALSVSENSADMLSTNLNMAGSTYAYMRKITSATFEKLIANYQQYTFNSQSDTSDYYTSMGKGKIRVNAQTVAAEESSYGIIGYGVDPYTGIYGPIYGTVTSGYFSKLQIYVDSVLKATITGTSAQEVLIDVSKGSSIRVRKTGGAYTTGDATVSMDVTASYGINWRGIQNSLQISNVTTSWDTIENMTSDYLVRGRWYCNTPITLDSNNYIAYALANSFISGFSGLPEGVSIQTDSAVSKVTYGGLSNTPITSVIYYGSSVRLYYSGGYVTFVAGANADGSFTGWYNATASISVLSKEGILTSNIIPKDTSREIGEFDNPFNKIWAKDIDLSGNLTVDGSISGGAISGSSVNTGQGDNELYAMNQNLRTVDSPNFNQITTLLGPNKPVDSNSRLVPSMGTGGFGWGISTTTTNPHVTLPTGGTYMVISIDHRGYLYDAGCGRLPGGTVISSGTTGMKVFAWRLA
nr:hypothetical protein [uncultured Sphaerochaeta sp.]